jgi:hypothetical protein
VKVAIVGAEEQTRHLAPYDDPSYIIWVFNEFANAAWCKRWDLLFQLHSPNVYRNLNNDKDPHHWEWLQRSHGKPVVMQKVDPLVPDSVAYPLSAVNHAFMSRFTYEGMQQKNIRATLCYAVALAVLAKAESIDIWGVELAYSAEYRSQQNNFAFWMGVASGRGIPVNLHCCKGMFDQPLYGYEDFMQEDQLQRYLEGVTLQIEEEKVKLAKLEGARMLLIQMLAEEKSQDVKEAKEQG